LVNTGGNAGLRGIVFEPIAWKTARFRAAQAAPYGLLQPSTNADKWSDMPCYQFSRCPGVINKCLCDGSGSRINEVTKPRGEGGCPRFDVTCAERIGQLPADQARMMSWRKRAPCPQPAQGWYQRPVRPGPG